MHSKAVQRRPGGTCIAVLASGLCVLLVNAAARAAETRSRAQAEVVAMLAQQSTAWSRGDIEAFCAVYAEDAQFLAPTGVTSGRAAVLARYKARYQGAAQMGELTLEPLALRDYPPRVVTVAARWTLVRKDLGRLSGLTLLVVEKRDGRWQIVQDASMSDAQ